MNAPKSMAMPTWAGTPSDSSGTIDPGHSGIIGGFRRSHSFDHP